MIRFRPYTWIGAGGGAVPVVRFTDNFARADTAQGLGAGWIGMPRSSLQSQQALPNARVLGATATTLTTGVGAGSQVPGICYLPVALLNASIFGLSQYAQMTWQSHVGNDADVGPAVMMSGDFASQNQQGYQFAVEVGANQLDLNLLTTVRTPIATTPYAPAAGDVWRIEVTPGVASNRVRCLVNGAVLVDLFDSTAARPIASGYPAVWIWASPIAASSVFSLWDGGLL